MPFINSPFFFCFVYYDFKQKIKYDVLMTHINLPTSEKYIWTIQNVHGKSRFFYISITRQWSLVQLGCLHLYGDSWVSRAQPRINDYEILLQHDWLLFFSRHNRFAETHSHFELSYHIRRPVISHVYMTSAWISFRGVIISHVTLSCSQ